MGQQGHKTPSERRRSTKSMIPIIYVKVGYLFDACKIYGAILFVISSFLLTVCCPYRLGTPIMMPQSFGRAHYFAFY